MGSNFISSFSLIDSQMQKFIQTEQCLLFRMLTVLTMCQELLTSDQHATKRDLYYQNNAKLFSRQSELDEVVNVVGTMLQIPRNKLRILATSKGLVAGE